jgi:hypothetical protein
LRLNTDPDQGPIRIRIQGFDEKKNVTIFTSEKEIFGSKTTTYLSLGLHKGFPSYGTVPKKPSALKREHPAVQNTKS